MSRRILLAASFAATLGGCGLVAGLGDFTDAPSTTAESSAASSGSGLGGSGGTSSSSSAASTSSGGGSGGASSSSVSSTSSVGGGGASSSSASGSGGGCVTPSDCPGVDDDCQARTCSGGLCGVSFTPSGPAASQVPGDCQSVVCDGSGGESSIADDSDPNDDNDACTVDGCSLGTPTHDAAAGGTPCMTGVCDGAKHCVECFSNSDCLSMVCNAFMCVTASCTDGTKNGDETSTDCGGSCSPCATGLSCSVAADCIGGDCTNNICQPTCTDGQKNQNESDVDCGGPCSPCALGKACMGAGDCATQNCVNGTCACGGTHLLISEVRSRGAGGGNDELVELYNPTNASVLLDSNWVLQARASNAGSYTSRWTGSGASIPSHGHYLIVGTAYTQSPSSDAPLTSGISDAASIVLKHSAAVVDAVCYQHDATTLAALQGMGFTCEGTPVSNLPHDDLSGGSSDTDVSISRLPGGALGNCVDTGNSSADFVTATPAKPQDSASAPTP